MACSCSCGNQEERILVLGAGELGMAVIDALVARNRRLRVPFAQTTITAVVRGGNADRDGELSARGVKVEKCDMENASDAVIVEMFKKHDTIISCTGMYMKPGFQLRIAQLALAVGVDRFFPWQYGLDYDAIGTGSQQDLFDEQLEVRALLRRSPDCAPTDWCIVSTGVFTSFLFEAGFGPVDCEKRVLRALGSWDTPITTTTARDIGRMVAMIACDQVHVGCEIVYLAGDTLTYRQLADLVEAKVGGHWTRELWDQEFLRKKLEADPDNNMVKYQNVFAKGVGVSWDVTKTLNFEMEENFEDVEMYLTRVLAAMERNDSNSPVPT
ncbi:hypothetical protein KJ359_005321 [Pestalotiopsis sp. 9143b]|nr:hypothetical protein KJ359_005321 [Pestalotiopsis sp. 9143b]